MSFNESSRCLSSEDLQGQSPSNHVVHVASTVIDAWRDAKEIEAAWLRSIGSYADKHGEHGFSFRPTVSESSHRSLSIDDVTRIKLDDLALNVLAVGRVRIDVTVAQPFDASAHWRALCDAYRPERAEAAANRQGAVQIVKELPFWAMAASSRNPHAQKAITVRPSSTTFQITVVSNLDFYRTSRKLHLASEERLLKVVDALALFCAWLEGDRCNDAREAKLLVSTASRGFSSRLKARIGPISLTLFRDHLDVCFPTPVCARLNEYLSTFAEVEFQSALQGK